MNKKIMAMLLTTALACGAAGCGGTGANSNKTPNIDYASYETNEKFITIIDLTPNPNASLEDYLGLGFSGFILTEDYVNLTQNGKVTDNYKKAMQNLNDNGLDVYIRNQFNDPYYFNTTVAGAAEYERKNYTLDNRALTDEFRANGGVSGFYMADEPNYDKIADFGPLIEWYNANYADTYFHMNLFPSYVGTAGLMGHTFAEYVQEYVDQVAKKVDGKKSICLDNYPFNKKGQIRPSFLSDLLITATKTKEYNDQADKEDQAFMGLCIQTFYDSGLVDITCSEDVSFQLLTGMAMGSKMYEYFCYRSYVDGATQLHGIFDRNMQKRVYDYVKDANAKYLGFEKVVNSFTWKGLSTITASEKKRVENEEAFSSVTDLTLQETGKLDLSRSQSKLDTIVGTFEKDGENGYMVVNYTLPSGGKTNVVELSFNDATHAVVYTAGENGIEATTVKLVEGGVRLSLDAGDGAFVIPVK